MWMNKFTSASEVIDIFTSAFSGTSPAKAPPTKVPPAKTPSVVAAPVNCPYLAIDDQDPQDPDDPEDPKDHEDPPEDLPEDPKGFCVSAGRKELIVLEGGALGVAQEAMGTDAEGRREDIGEGQTKRRG